MLKTINLAIAAIVKHIYNHIYVLRLFKEVWAMVKSEKILFVIPVVLKAKLVKMAEEKGVTVSDFIRDAIKEKLLREVENRVIK